MKEAAAPLLKCRRESHWKANMKQGSALIVERANSVHEHKTVQMCSIIKTHWFEVQSTTDNLLQKIKTWLLKPEF